MTARQALGLVMSLFACAGLGPVVRPQAAPAYLQAMLEGANWFSQRAFGRWMEPLWRPAVAARGSRSQNAIASEAAERWLTGLQSIGVTSSPSRIVPPTRMSARNPPRWTSGRRRPGPESFSR